MRLNGLAVAVAIRPDSSKNSTLATFPSLSLALQARAMLAGAVKAALFVGLIMLAIGARLLAGFTVIVTGCDKAVIPSEPVALAVIT
jgi:hypothetical protein